MEIKLLKIDGELFVEVSSLTQWFSDQQRYCSADSDLYHFCDHVIGYFKDLNLEHMEIELELDEDGQDD